MKLFFPKTGLLPNYKTAPNPKSIHSTSNNSIKMAFRLVVLCAALACANAGYLGGSLAYSAAPAYAYGAAPLAAPALGSTFHGRLAAPAVAYAAPAFSAYSAPATYAAPAITSQHSNIIRSFGNLGQVSTYSKSIDTPFSSVRKADIRVSNPGVRFAAAAPAIAYSAAPAISTYHAPAIAAPAFSAYHAPAAIAAPVARLGVAYSAAPAVSHINYASAYANYGW